ncbi:glutathione S-transferase [Methyloradius palustris]|uniref:Glutathione S-transferase n=1 Tax=Methyloradius palustris TaxID=2778876 RepID=A0A8D5JQ66_9PROT|nr:glutathione S-transferase [Methyloradius palustris]BCM24206.1 glutathione S-transferase [Methyloradius palustris]
MSIPILYSYRRCPYAMRARMALRYSDITVEIIEISLRDKPQHLLEVSPKATVPVLALPDGKVIEQSLEIMQWALLQQDKDDWLSNSASELAIDANRLISENDGTFKQALDRYKYAVRFPEHSQEEYRQQCEVFVSKLEALLVQHHYLLGSNCSIADIAIFPFVRQFAGVDEPWFSQAPYPKVRAWLNEWVNSPLFISIMQK